VCYAGASNGGRSLCFQISRERSYPCQYIDTTRQAIDCATTLPLTVFTGSIARSASRRYLIYSEVDFEVFLDVAPMGVKFGMEEGTKGPSSMPNFTPMGATTRV